MQSNAETLLLDVREKSEYRQGHIPSSTNIPVGHLQTMKNRLPKDKQTPIITYCLSGMRARSACSVLSRFGYHNIYCLGSIGAWPYGIQTR
jgi:rhodanese-related sulfurtransferase